jgi:2-methylcitrate dehydratase PrpD
MFKPYPCGVVLNPVIDACLTARAASGFSLAGVEEIVVRGAPLLKARADRPHVTTGREAQVSTQHAVAVSLLRGTAGAADFADAAVADAEVSRLRARVRPVEVDGASSIDAAEIAIRYDHGAVVRIRETAATGSLARPISDAALQSKFAALAAYGCPGLDAAPLAARLWKFPTLADAGAVMALARPSSHGA